MYRLVFSVLLTHLTSVVYTAFVSPSNSAAVSTPPATAQSDVTGQYQECPKGALELDNFCAWFTANRTVFSDVHLSCQSDNMFAIPEGISQARMLQWYRTAAVRRKVGHLTNKIWTGFESEDEKKCQIFDFKKDDVRFIKRCSPKASRIIRRPYFCFQKKKACKMVTDTLNNWNKGVPNYKTVLSEQDCKLMCLRDYLCKAITHYTVFGVETCSLYLTADKEARPQSDQEVVTGIGNKVFTKEGACGSKDSIVVIAAPAGPELGGQSDEPSWSELIGDGSAECYRDDQCGPNMTCVENSFCAPRCRVRSECERGKRCVYNACRTVYWIS